MHGSNIRELNNVLAIILVWFSNTMEGRYACIYHMIFRLCNFLVDLVGLANSEQIQQQGMQDAWTDTMELIIYLHSRLGI